jgi:UDP-N-acetylglucosamine acyltransferase
VVVGDYVVTGGGSAVHQFARVGEGAMLAGFSGLEGDLIPFGLAKDQRAVLNGLNIVGMKRRGYPAEEIRRARLAYRQLFEGQGTFKERVAQTEQDFGGDPIVQKILAFIRAGGKRPLLTMTNRAALRDGISDAP